MKHRTPHFLINYHSKHQQQGSLLLKLSRGCFEILSLKTSFIMLKIISLAAKPSHLSSYIKLILRHIPVTVIFPAVLLTAIFPVRVCLVRHLYVRLASSSEVLYTSNSPLCSTVYRSSVKNKKMFKFSQFNKYVSYQQIFNTNFYIYNAIRCKHLVEKFVLASNE